MALLTACGGGGGDAPAATSAGNTAVSSVGASTCGLPDFAASALARINRFRAAGANCRTGGVFAPAPPLAWSDKLTQAAAAHSLDMAAQNYFSHTSADGRTLEDRIDASGYAWSGIGENIAAGYATVNIVTDGWMISDGHCANIMSPTFTEVGLACVPGGASNTYDTYWTMDLARPR